MVIIHLIGIHHDIHLSGARQSLKVGSDSSLKGQAVTRLAFAKALLDEAAMLFLSGEPAAARLILRDLVNATIGFEYLAVVTHKPSKSLHRMLSLKGNPSMDNLAAIFGAVRDGLKVAFDVRVVEAAH